MKTKTIVFSVSLALFSSKDFTASYRWHSTFKSCRPKSMANFETDMFGDSTNQDVLEQMRVERIISNDRWQSCSFRDTQCGEWAGIYEVYTISNFQQNDNFLTAQKWGGFSFPKVAYGNVYSDFRSSEYEFNGVNISTVESYDPELEVAALMPTSFSLLTTRTKEFCKSYEFRPSKGNQIVGGAFTFCSVSDSRYLSEIAIKEGTVRTRVRYLYESLQTQPNLSAYLAEEDKDPLDLTLTGFTVIRERYIGERDSLSLPSFEPFRGGEEGRGIYDPQEAGEPYVELRLPGLLTLFFPRYLRAGRSATLAMEWWGDRMRYQVDRKLSANRIGGEIRALELTEVTIEDSEQYPALFPQSPDFLK